MNFPVSIKGVLVVDLVVGRKGPEALVSLGKHLGMFTERHFFEGTIQHMLTKMTPAERLARAE